MAVSRIRCIAVGSARLNEVLGGDISTIDEVVDVQSSAAVPVRIPRFFHVRRIEAEKKKQKISFWFGLG